MGQRIEVVLDDQGRLVLPSPLRRRLGLTTGMTLVVEEETADAAYLRILTGEPSLVEKQGVLVVQAQPPGNPMPQDDPVRQERDRRVADLLRRTGI